MNQPTTTTARKAIRYFQSRRGPERLTGGSLPQNQGLIVGVRHEKPENMYGWADSGSHDPDASNGHHGPAGENNRAATATATRTEEIPLRTGLEALLLIPNRDVEDTSFFDIISDGSEIGPAGDLVTEETSIEILSWPEEDVEEDGSLSQSYIESVAASLLEDPVHKNSAASEDPTQELPALQIHAAEPETAENETAENETVETETDELTTAGTHKPDGEIEPQRKTSGNGASSADKTPAPDDAAGDALPETADKPYARQEEERAGAPDQPTAHDTPDTTEAAEAAATTEDTEDTNQVAGPPELATQDTGSTGLASELSLQDAFNMTQTFSKQPQDREAGTKTEAATGDQPTDESAHASPGSEHGEDGTDTVESKQAIQPKTQTTPPRRATDHTPPEPGRQSSWPGAAAPTSGDLRQSEDPEDSHENPETDETPTKPRIADRDPYALDDVTGIATEQSGGDTASGEAQQRVRPVLEDIGWLERLSSGKTQTPEHRAYLISLQAASKLSSKLRFRRAPEPPPRLASVHAAPEPAVERIATSSAGPGIVVPMISKGGTGKTTIAIETAFTLGMMFGAHGNNTSARTGRVLLIDVNLTNPDLAHRISVDGSGRMGMKDLVAGEHLSRVVNRTALPNVDALFCLGRGDNDKGDLPLVFGDHTATSSLMRAIMGSGHYDVIVVDTANTLPAEADNPASFALTAWANMADARYLVLQPEVASFKNAASFAAHLGDALGDNAETVPILNSFPIQKVYEEAPITGQMAEKRQAALAAVKYLQTSPDYPVVSAIGQKGTPLDTPLIVPDYPEEVRGFAAEGRPLSMFSQTFANAYGRIALDALRRMLDNRS